MSYTIPPDLRYKPLTSMEIRQAEVGNNLKNLKDATDKSCEAIRESIDIISKLDFKRQRLPRKLKKWVKKHSFLTVAQYIEYKNTPVWKRHQYNLGVSSWPAIIISDKFVAGSFNWYMTKEFYDEHGRNFIVEATVSQPATLRIAGVEYHYMVSEMNPNKFFEWLNGSAEVEPEVKQQIINLYK